MVLPFSEYDFFIFEPKKTYIDTYYTHHPFQPKKKLGSNPTNLNIQLAPPKKKLRAPRPHESEVPDQNPKSLKALHEANEYPPGN